MGRRASRKRPARPSLLGWWRRFGCLRLWHAPATFARVPARGVATGRWRPSFRRGVDTLLGKTPSSWWADDTTVQDVSCRDVTLGREINNGVWPPKFASGSACEFLGTPALDKEVFR